MDNTDWRRWDYYSQFMKKLVISKNGPEHDFEKVFLEMKRYRAPCTWLPKLQELQVDAELPGLPSRSLIGENLISFLMKGLDADYLGALPAVEMNREIDRKRVELGDTLDTLAARGCTLKELRISYYLDSYHAKSLRQVIQNSRLISFDCWNAVADASVIQSLQQLETLTHLKTKIVIETMPYWYFGQWSNVSTLLLSVDKLHHAIPALNTCSKCPLTNLVLTSTSTITCHEIHMVLETLNNSSWPLDLIELRGFRHIDQTELHSSVPSILQQIRRLTLRPTITGLVLKTMPHALHQQLDISWLRGYDELLLRDLWRKIGQRDLFFSFHRDNLVDIMFN